MRNSFWISLIAAVFISAILVANFDEDIFMKSVIESGLLSEKAEISEVEIQNAFMEFVAEYQKSYYNSYEFENRYLTFKDNYQRIADHNLNADMIGFTLKVNQFGDLSQEEFKAKYLTLKEKPQTRFGHKKHSFSKKSFLDSFLDIEEEEEIRVPKAVDWRAEGKVQAVKNQGSCGSCWAFSAVGAIESAVAIETGVLPDLSEQQFVDCAGGKYQNEGCNGGLMDWAFEYAEDHPVCTETEYKYTGRDGKCLDDDDSLCGKGVSVKDFVDVEQHSKTALQAAVAERPVSIGVCAEGLGWQFYFGGVVRWLCFKCQDHGVLLVGYDHAKSKIFGDTDYWIIKNSWGSGWGEKGYIRVKADDSGKGTCGVMESPSYPVV